MEFFTRVFRVIRWSCLPLLLCTLVFAHGSDTDDFRNWTLEQALEILNDSAWARHQTDTEVIAEIGSGVDGEKEIYSRYFVRFLSARPVRQAYARVGQILNDYDSLSRQKRREVDALFQESLGLDMEDWIVIAVSFRSNDRRLEQRVRNSLQAQTSDTMKRLAYLSTERFPQLEIAAYYPAIEDAVGAKFVFPSRVNGIPVISSEDESLAFELELPGRVPGLRVTFPSSGGVEEIMTQKQLPEERNSLQEIKDYQIGVAEFRRAAHASTQELAELVNKFPAQRRGLFHGSIYEFHRNDNLDARNFFDHVGRALPEYKRNQFGFTFGFVLGPRLNVFSSYDALRIIQGSTLLSHVPTPSMKRGDFSELLSGDFQIQLRDPHTGEAFAGNHLPEDRIHPVSRRLLSLLPDPNRPDPSRNFVNNQPFVENRDTFSVRVNFELDERNRFSVDGDFRRRDELEVHPVPTFGTESNDLDQEIRIGYAGTISSNLVATMEVDFEREDEFEIPRGDRPGGLLDSLGISGVEAADQQEEGYPEFELAGYRSFGDSGTPSGDVSNSYRFDAGITYVRGNHTLQFTGQVNVDQLNNDRSPALKRGSFRFSGAYTGDAFADFLLGLPDSASRAIGSSRADLRSKSFEVQFRDEWKISPRFNLSLGLSYNYFGPYQSIHEDVSLFSPLVFEPPEEGRLIYGDLNGMVRPDRNNWAPRLGVAYRPFSSNWLVLRASYQVFYEPLESWAYPRYMMRNFPFFYTEIAQASVQGPGLNLAFPFEAAVPAELAVRGIEPGLRTAYFQHWEFQIDNALSENWEIAVEYEGDKGTNLERVLPANVPVPGPGSIQARRPNSNFGQFAILTGSGSFSNHEMSVSAERRLADGISGLFGFEWGRRFSDDFEEPANPRNLRAERAPAGQPVRSLFLQYIFHLPIGPEHRMGGNFPRWLQHLLGNWRLSGITRLEDGRLFSPELPGDPNNDGVSGDRPDRLGSGWIEPSERTIDRWFRTEDFVSPAQYSFGDAGRNILWSPGYRNWDLSLVKNLLFLNGHRLEMRFEFFNAFNQVNFEEPDPTFGTSNFGKIFGAQRAREIEIALKYSF
ncbi:MAG: hypothetical protein ACRD1R_16250 [Acidobacteriota bacterium]